MPRVLFIQRDLKHYRVPFYERLKPSLEEAGISLSLVYGRPTAINESRRDAAVIDWADPIDNVGGRLGKVKLLWQPALDRSRGYDLVIVEQANRLVLNYMLLARRLYRKQKVAFWGHGLHFQADNPGGPLERWKRFVSRFPDWWFAYTELTREVLLEVGYPGSRITVVDNAVDTTTFRAVRESVTEQEIATRRAELGLGVGPVGVYCGSLYEHKKLDFLIEAVERIRTRVPDFELVVIGAGPDAPLIERAAERHGWVHFVGPKFDREKAEILALGDVFLNPGLVGLAILDAFASGLPMITTDCGLHSPEISYLAHGENGFMTDVSLEEYAACVVKLLGDDGELERLGKRCRADADVYTIEKMADNFAGGILAALGTF